MNIIIAAIAVYPPDEGEIKKAFVRTQRASRLLGTAFALAFLATLLLLALRQILLIPDSDRLQAAFIGVGSIGIFLLAPLWLILGNILMIPVEGLLRRRFIKKAEDVLAAINPKIIWR